MRVFIPRFLGAIAYLVVLSVVGTIGYVAIEGWPWREALYMTVITLTAVGFQEVRPLSELGRDFTMVLLAAGITGVGVWFALITSFIVEFDLGDVRKRRWRECMLGNLDGHLRPEVVSFLDIVTRSEGMELRFEQAVVQSDSQLAGRTLIDARIPQETGLIVIAVRKQIDETREFVFNPAANTGSTSVMR